MMVQTSEKQSEAPHKGGLYRRRLSSLISPSNSVAWGYQ